MKIQLFQNFLSINLKAILIITCVFIAVGCNNEQQENEKIGRQADDVSVTTTEITTTEITTTDVMVEVITEESSQEDVEEITEEPDTREFVKVVDYIPDIVVDLKYATEDNFTGKKIYVFSDAYLRYGTVLRLEKVQQELRKQNLGLKIWDGFRPVSAQFVLWEVCPDSRYVANPNTGYSSHSQGGTVDITLVDSEGNEIEMPTGFDDFSNLADRDYSDCSEEAAENAILLENIMKIYGFDPYYGEWWHYSDIDSYPVDTSFEP